MIADISSTSPDTVRLAQISDLHLGPMLLPPWRLLTLKRALGMANWYRKRHSEHLPAVAAAIAADVKAQRPQHITVTGDLINIGLPAEIARATLWLQQLGSPADVSVIPGNHDIYSSVHGRNIGAAALAPWRAFMTSDTERARYIETGETFPFVRVLQRGRTRVALIGLNSAIETQPFYAIGTLGVSQRQRLAQILDATYRDGCARVVMLHHPPLPHGAKARHELTDAAELADVLRAHGAELVLHGHNHRRSVTRLAAVHGEIPIVCVPSASIGVDTKRGEDLARSHIFEITARHDSAEKGPARAAITLIARGLTAPGSGISEVERQEL
jgi:3',5'-cyclic AMP phosphodiesterase CpdA